MLKKHFLLALLLSSIFHSVISNNAVSKCKTFCPGTACPCIFSGVNLTLTNYDWTPTADNPATVAYVGFSSSVIPVVTNVICKTFSNLDILKLNKLGVQEVLEDAFHNCSSLKELYLYQNQIKKFHPNTFMYLKSLTFLSVSENQIMELNDYQIFRGLQNLKKIHLYDNNLTDFSPELVRYNSKLENLSVYSNYLTDLDVEKIVEFLPNLKYLMWQDNEVACSRAVDANNFLRARGIAMSSYIEYKVRYYPTEYVFGTFRCNPDISWMASNYRKQNSDLKKQISSMKLELEQKMDEIRRQIKFVI